MNDGILFSVIMPCYNSADYVERAIQSCIEQSYTNWELIVVNDGSTDNTVDIIKSYMQMDDRIQLFSKENGGYVSAVNEGLEHISGEYFLLLGSDDELDPVLFSELSNRIEDGKNIDLVGFGTLIVDSNGNQKYDYLSKFENVTKERDISFKSFTERHPTESRMFFVRDTSRLFKRDLLGDLRYFGKSGMDADGVFSMLFAHKASSFICVPTIGYIWHVREGSVSRRKHSIDTKIDRIKTWMKYGKVLMEQYSAELITQQEKKYLLEQFLFHFDFKVICLSCMDWPFNIVQESKLFLTSLIEWFGCEKSKDLSFFFKHPFIWGMYVSVYNMKKQSKKRLKLIQSGYKKR